MNENNKTKTTERIKDVLGASYTVEEVETFLADSEAKSLAEGPYFDGRLVARIERLKYALGY